jgi:hypothetical protein
MVTIKKAPVRAQFEISIDGKPCSYRDRKDIAIRCGGDERCPLSDHRPTRCGDFACCRSAASSPVAPAISINDLASAGYFGCNFLAVCSCSALECDALARSACELVHTVAVVISA